MAAAAFVACRFSPDSQITVRQGAPIVREQDRRTAHRSGRNKP